MNLFAIEWLLSDMNRQYLIGCGVAVVVFLAIVLLLGRSKRSGSSRKRDLLDGYDPTKASNGPEDRMFGDRRTNVRREGKPVGVHLTSASFQGEPKEGYVLDRSTGGLKIAIDTPVSPGTTMQILAQNAPDTTPWLPIVVRSCKPVGKRFDLGCEFETTPPWNILLLFG